MEDKRIGNRVVTDWFWMQTLSPFDNLPENVIVELFHRSWKCKFTMIDIEHNISPAMEFSFVCHPIKTC